MNRQEWTVEHDPEGYACNMGWTLKDARGIVLYRGPEWACRVRLQNEVDLYTGLRTVTL